MSDRENAIPLLFLCLGIDPWDYNRIRFAAITASEFEEGESPELLPHALSGMRQWGQERSHSYSRGRSKKWGRFGGFPSCGTVYEIEAELTEDGGSIWPGTMAHKGLWPVVEDRQQWGAADDARKREFEGSKESAKDDWREALEPIRDAYRSMRGPQRVQLIARVVTFINS